jgi:3-oxoacyl-[acyl-carrier-protein] synthase II
VAQRRVVVTGLGTVSPLGGDWPTSWAGLLAGRSGLGPLTLADAGDLPLRAAGKCRGFDALERLGPRPARQLDRAAQLAVVAAREARAAAGFDGQVDPARTGVVVGTGLGGITSYDREAGVLAQRGPRRVSPFLAPAFIPNAPASAVGMDAGATGPSFAPTSACAAGTDALGLAVDMIRLGRADAVLAGGAEAPFARTMLAAFAVMRAVSAREAPGASTPFSLGRDGFVPAEGAAVLLLEAEESARARGAPVLAEVAGYGAASDAHHVVAPDPAGRGAAAALRAALADAGLAPGDVDAVNAHATSTPDGDLAEARALHAVFGGSVPPVSATKALTGHLLGAAGAFEAAASVQALVDGVVPPTCHHTPDPEIDLDVVAEGARRLPLEVVVSESFGFGGHDAVVVLRRA